MAGEIYIADKATLDLIKTDTTAIRNTPAKVRRAMIFAASGTFVTPAGCTEVYLTACGGGGGGGGAGTSGTQTGGTGGITSFGSLLSLVGGSGGQGFASNGLGGAGGGYGEDGERGSHSVTGIPDKGGCGGASLGFRSGSGWQVDAYPTAGVNGKLGSGGSGASGQAGGTTTSGGGGGGGNWVRGYPVTVVASTSYAITIGAGGAKGTQGYGTQDGGLGGPGYMMVEWYE